MRKIITYTIGADPELFIVNEKTKKVVSSIGLIPGEKGNPYVGEDMPSGFGLETDNILAEFNIPPSTDQISFINNIEYMKNYIDRFVKDKNPELGIKCAASMKVDPDQLNSPEARLFGCDPDYNVYTECMNPKPEGERTNLRSAGFHIHFGYPNFNTESSLRMVKYFDLYLGLPSVLLDKDTQRRKLYGKAGSFRLCSYGFEYRTLSSAMMADRDKLRTIWSGIEKAVFAFNRGVSLPESGYVRKAINENDIDLAKALIKKYNVLNTEDLCAESSDTL